MEISDKQKEYLRVIYILNKTQSVARVTDIAKKLNKTKPTVNYAINSLKQEGLVNYETYGAISLTQLGERIAKKLLEAYDIISLFLSEILKLDSEKVKQEASKMKAILDDETINKFAVYTHKELGLYSLECGYDINNERCINCLRRKERKVN